MIKGSQNRREELAKVVRAWWQALQPQPTGNAQQRSEGGARRAGLARLRRAPSTMAALLEPEVIDLCRRLKPFDVEHARAATIARILAHVRSAQPATGQRGALVRVLGPKSNDKNGEGAVLKRLRLERLLDTTGEEELARSMIRLLQLAGRDRPIDIGDLAASVADWNQDQVRIAWAYAYYDVDSAPSGDAPAPTIF